jgi:hypothetical protein
LTQLHFMLPVNCAFLMKTNTAQTERANKSRYAQIVLRVRLKNKMNLSIQERRSHPLSSPKQTKVELLKKSVLRRTLTVKSF